MEGLGTALGLALRRVWDEPRCEDGQGLFLQNGDGRFREHVVGRG